MQRAFGSHLFLPFPPFFSLREMMNVFGVEIGSVSAFGMSIVVGGVVGEIEAIAQ